MRTVVALAIVGTTAAFSAPPRPLLRVAPRPLLQPISSSPRITDTPLHADTTMNGANGDVAKPQQPSFLQVVWRFTRPHTIIGSALAIPSLHLLAAPSVEAAFSTASGISILYAMLPALLMNLYVTGLNQITDVEIDKINKPNLPIAAGILSPRDAKVIVAISLVVSLLLGVANPVLGTQGLNVALWGSAFLGTIYSVEPLRFKRFPLLAAFCIVAVRGTIINAGFFAHAKAAAFGQPSCTVLSCLLNDPKCFLSSLFFAVFGVVIALMKDVPDVLGDRTLNIRTLSVRLGQNRIFSSMRNLLRGLFYGCGAAFMVRAAASSSAAAPGVAACRVVTGVAAGLFGWSVQKESVGVDPTNSEEVYGYYMHLWKLFYLSYLVLPFAM